MAVTSQTSSQTPSSAPSEAGVVGYLVLLLTLAKLARGVELAARVGSLRPLWMLPASVGEDLLLLGVLGLLAHGLGRLRRTWLRRSVTLSLLVPIALLLPCDVLSYKLTGRPLTLHRLMGGEGATLADSRLLDPVDLFGVSGAMVLALSLLWPALRHGPRIAWLRRFARPRAQLVTLFVGGALSLLQSALLPRLQELADQPVFVLVGSVFDRGALQARAIDDRAWRALLEPGVPVPPAPPVPPRPASPVRNVVIFLAEGVPFKATGFDRRFAGGIDPTPHLTRRWAQDGLLFDHYHATWHASIQAIFSIVCSMFPPMSGDIVRIKPRIDCGEFSEVMRARGVEPGLFHSGQFSFYNKLALLGRRGYAAELDASELAKTSSRATHEWGIDDRAMVEGALHWIDGLPKQQRFAALMIAVSPHYPYWLPADFVPPFPVDSREHQFLNGVSFVDSAFEQLLQGFEARGLYDDTLFVWLGDHGHYVGEPERETPGLRQFYEPNLRTPLLLLNRKMFPSTLSPQARVNARLGSHVDLLPTLLDALGEAPDPRHQGRSLLAAEFEPRRVFFGATDGRYVGFLEGDHKFVARTRRKGSEYYDLTRDPEELHDLSGQFPERMERYGAEAVRFAGASEARIAAMPLLREDVSVSEIYELFMQHVEVRVASDAAPECRGDSALQCEGVGRILRVETARVTGDQRRCVFARLPTEGTLELSVRDPATLELMTGTTLALRGRKGRPPVNVVVFADSEEQSRNLLTARTAIRPRHARPERELRFRFRQLPAKAANPSEPAGEPDEVCLQLTNLFSR